MIALLRTRDPAEWLGTDELQTLIEFFPEEERFDLVRTSSPEALRALRETRPAHLPGPPADPSAALGE